MRDKEFCSIVSVSCLVVFILVVYGFAFYGFGKAQGIKECYETRQQIQTGQPPAGKPVMVFWTREDGTIDGESAMMTDYAGVLPFSVTGSAVPYTVYEGYDRWTVLDQAFAGVSP